jgi:hypothetical protein
MLLLIVSYYCGVTVTPTEAFATDGVPFRTIGSPSANYHNVSWDREQFASTDVKADTTTIPIFIDDSSGQFIAHGCCLAHLAFHDASHIAR